MNNLPSRWPGVVVSYDGPTRTCKVSIPGITDGSSELPEAVFENPLGDRASETEIHIEAGDLVWLSFECGDPRYPIITGYRTPREGNPVAWRRYRHANIELTADGQMILNATELIINAQTTVNGDVATVGALTNNGQNVGETHYHDEQGDFSPTSTARG